MMIYLLNDNWLPWSNFSKEFKGNNYQFEDYLRERLNVKYSKEAIMLCPNALRTVFKKILTLNFEDDPPYDELIELMKVEICKEVRIGPDLEPISHEFEWQQNIASRMKAHYLKESH